MKKIFLMATCLSVLLMINACKKEFLDAKPNKALLIPTTLSDIALLLDNLSVMNKAPSIQEIASDDFYSTPAGFVSLGIVEKNSYLWASDIYEGAAAGDWVNSYQQIFYANVALNALKSIKTDQIEINNLMGSAYFYRGLALYNLSQLFAPTYQSKSATRDLGLPIRLTSDVNEKSVRSTLAETYAQIIKDLTLAVELLPVQMPIKSRPSQTAANGLLARVFLSMGNYQLAKEYADQCLKQNGKLLDYNFLKPSTGLPFPTSLPNGNEEILFHTSLLAYLYIGGTQTVVAPALFNAYEENDLRKEFLYLTRNGLLNFRGTYSGPSTPGSIFSGIANDEVYLIRAESKVRTGDVNGAVDDLNFLLKYRYKTGTFIPINLSDAHQLLIKILNERRKELVSRGLRWTDLRRLNTDPDFAVTLTRVMNGQSYVLSPGSNRYTFPIPEQEILASGIEQNKR